MNPRALLLALWTITGCLTLAPPTLSPDAAAVDARPPPLHLVSVTSSTGDLDAVGRLPSLTLRFDRAIAPPGPDDVTLFDLPPSTSLSTDLGHGDISAAHAAHRLAARVTVSDDGASLAVRGRTPQLPDAVLTLGVTTHVRARDGATLLDGVDAARLIALRVAPAARCGPLATALVVDASVPAGAPTLAVRFDAPVRAEGASVSFTVDDRPVDVALTLDCFDGRGGARCAWVRPVAPLPDGSALRWVGASLRGDDGAQVEVPPVDLDARAVTHPPPRFGAPIVCARDEATVGGLCVRRSDDAVELRVATTEPSLVRASTRLSPTEVRAAIGEAGTLHMLRLEPLPPATELTVSLDALTLDGAVVDTMRIPLIATTQRAPRVRVSEVVARPRGAGGQEYVELVNDDSVAVPLRDWSIASDTGRSVLPTTAAIAARGRALVVGDAFDPRGSSTSGDPAVAPGATVIVVRGALAGRGLRDSGAPWTLLDAQGNVVSAVPGDAPGRTPRAGVGLVRATMRLPDRDPAAWAYDARDGCTPGAPDRTRE